MRMYRTEIKVEWAHCDAAGIVFYPHFYTWFDQATERLFSANALSYKELEQDFNTAGMPLLETGARYENASRLGDQLTMETEVSEWAGKIFTVSHTLTHADRRPALKGFERRIWVTRDPEHPAGIRSIPVPDEIKARFKD